MKFSILITNFNSGKYVHRCLDSIFSQDYENYEVIFIDDGSEDDSLSIVNKYQEKYKDKLKLIKQENHGVSFSRNVAATCAKGDYLFFLDSDDWIHPRTLQLLNSSISNENDIDCIIFSLTEIFPDHEIRSNMLNPVANKVGNRSFNYKDIGEDLIYIFGGMSTKVVRRVFYERSQIRFNPELRTAEDLCVSLEIISKAKSIKVINYPLYFYRKNMDGKSLATSHMSHLDKSLEYAISRVADFYGKAVIIDRFLQVMLYVYNRPDYTKDLSSLKIIERRFKELQGCIFENQYTRNYCRVAKQLSLSHKIKNTIKTFSFKNIKRHYSSLKQINSLNKIKKDQISVLQRVKLKFKKTETIKVGFLISELAKIKTSSLIEELCSDNRFEPIVIITTLSDVAYSSDIKSELKKIEYFCQAKDFLYFNAYDCRNGKPLSLEQLNLDLIFYQQPWGIHKIHSIKKLSKKTLPCYVPYYIPNYGSLKLDCQYFHKQLFRYYILDRCYNDQYKKYLYPFVQQLRVVGHTEYDQFFQFSKSNKHRNFVIYAPHWSLGNGTVKYSTFMWSGSLILQFAESHPEFNWVFKPHPRLKRELVRKGLMSSMDVDNYFERWEKVADVSTDNEYIKYFVDSKCLITDCGSFLMEYFPTKMPVLHLVSNMSAQPCDSLATVINSYYQVFNGAELQKMLEILILNDSDYKKDSRELLISDGTINTGDEINTCARRIKNDLIATLKENVLSVNKKG